MYVYLSLSLSIYIYILYICMYNYLYIEVGGGGNRSRVPNPGELCYWFMSPSGNSFRFFHLNGFRKTEFEETAESERTS